MKYGYDTSWKVEVVDGNTLLAPEPVQEEKQELLEALREKGRSCKVNGKKRCTID